LQTSLKMSHSVADIVELIRPNSMMEPEMGEGMEEGMKDHRFSISLC